MSTTTIRLPPELKSRVAKAAERAGTTAHGFILDAIAEKTEEFDRRMDFVEVAERRYAKIAETGKAVPWENMRRYMKQRLAGKKLARPKARSIAR